MLDQFRIRITTTVTAPHFHHVWMCPIKLFQAYWHQGNRVVAYEHGKLTYTTVVNPLAILIGSGVLGSQSGVVPSSSPLDSWKINLPVAISYDNYIEQPSSEEILPRLSVAWNISFMSHLGNWELPTAATGERMLDSRWVNDLIFLLRHSVTEDAGW